MKLYCSEVYPNFEDVFSAGKFYDIRTISPNKLMVSVISDTGDECLVVHQTSIYGKFTIKEEA